MEFKEATRKDTKIKADFSSISGGGKTMSALLAAKGMMNGDMSKVAVAQTEIGRAQCYVDRVGKFKILEVLPPYHPNKIKEIIALAEKSGIRVLIIDSISDFWAGVGGTLDLHTAASEVTKNSFSAWKKITPIQEGMMGDILSAGIHVFVTTKKKAEYVLESVNGKQVVKKVGLKEIQKDGIEYRWMLQFDIDRDSHLATASKDNLGLFDGKPPFLINEETGKAIRDWCLKE